MTTLQIYEDTDTILVDLDSMPQVDVYLTEYPNIDAELEIFPDISIALVVVDVISRKMLTDYENKWLEDAGGAFIYEVI